MKKNLKKVLSVILTLMMVFSCFSGIGHIEAKALPATDSTYATGDKYGTVKWSGTGDRWFRWSTGSDYVKVYYPSHIYLDISETLQSAGYHFDVEWHFGDSSKYRILLGAPVWGDHRAFSGMPTKYYTMTNIFSDYAVDASLPKGAPAGWYNDGTGSSTDYDLRIVGYNYSSQGTDGFTQNGARHEKYVLWRTNTSYYNPSSGSIYLKGTPSSSYVGKTTEYNTSGGSVGSYGLAQQYGNNNTWSTASSASMFNTKGSDSSYMEGQWIEMQWYVTVYDKSTLNSEILKASQVISQQNGYDAYIVSGSMSDLKQHNSEAQTTITVREQTQTDIENQRIALQNAAAALYYGASNAELRQLVSEAESYVGSAEYSAKYSESSRADLESALANAKALSYYSSVPTYKAYNNSSAGANAARDQATIDSVANELNTAIEKLKTSVSVYTYTFNKADGTSKTLTYAYGYTIPASAIPANTVKEADILNHYTYTWDKEIEYTVTGNVVFNEVLATEAHDWSDWVTTVYPSCSAEGNEYRECNVCTYRQDIPIQKTAHTPMEPVITDEVPATCTAEGSYLSTVYCSECSEVVSSQTVEVAKLAHTPGEKVIENNIPFTCTEDGSYDEVYYCTECGTEISRKNILVGAAHIDGEPIVEVQEPTCLVAGVTRTTVLCAVCGQLLRETVVPGEIGEHTPGEAVKENIVDAGCTEGGSYDMVTRCTVCQFIISSEHFTTQAGEHDWGDWEIVTPVTCTENGLEQRVCKNDPSHIEENIIRSNGHTAGETKEVEKVEPSCIDPGYVVTVTYCSVCGGEVERTRTNIAAVGHSFGDWYVNVEASCTKEGEEKRDCNNCKHSETKVIEMKDHDYESVVTLPTCTKDGYTTYDCKNCDASYIDDETGMLGHKNADPVIENEVEAECEKEGSYDTVVYCSVCGEELSRVKTTVPAKDHTEAAAVIENEVEAECETEGSYDTVVYCSVCNKELSRVKTTVPAKDHTEAAAVIENEVEAECETEGSYDTVVYCSVCKKELSRVKTTVDATDHDWDEWQTVTPATCGADGLEKRVCKNNSAHYEENVIKATGEHVYATEVDRKDATCTEDGYVIMACGCGATEKTDILSEGHKEAEAVTENKVAADCENDGSYDTVVYCSVCDEELSRVKTIVPKLGHKEVTAVTENEVEAECEKEGSYDTVVYCSVCNKELSRVKTTVPAKDHTEADAVLENEVEAECETEGSYDTVVYCSVCGEELSRVKTTVPAKEHTEADAVIENEVEADCENAGSYDEVVYCTVCNKELSRETKEVPKLGHKEAEAVTENEVAAECEKEGSYDTVVYCSVCNKELSRVTTTVDATDHDWDEWVTVTPASCADDGLEKRVCKNNSAHYEEKVIKATGEHVYATEVDRKDATCTEDGYVIMACGCGATEKTDILSEGHKEAEAVTENEVAADCENDGSYDTVVYCAVCNKELSRVTTTVDALGHKEAEAVIENEVAADCENDGSYDTVVYCSVCNKELSRVKTTVDALGHEEAEAVIENEVAADCENDGSYDTVVYCSVCDKELSRVTTTVDALGHKEAEAVIENEVAADCENDGSYDTVVYCAVCNKELSRVTTTVDALGHEEEELPAVAPDCLTDGLKAGVKCTVCGKILVAQETDPALGHNMSEFVETKAPSCSEKGEERSDCSRCDHYEVRELSKLAHTEETVSGKAPTCTENGLTDGITCSVCGEAIKTQTVITAPGHKYGEWVVDRQPTCTEKGIETATCSECGYVQTRELPMTEHNYDSDGVCSDCGAEEKCMHICHRQHNIFARIVWSIILFICKIFGFAKTCSCGAAHY